MEIKAYRGRGTLKNEVFVYFSGRCKTVQKRGKDWFIYNSDEGWLNKKTLCKAIIHVINS